MSLTSIALGLDHRHIYGMTENMEKAGVKCLGFWTEGSPETLAGISQTVSRFETFRQSRGGARQRR